jgi:hypothetical protein
MNWGLFRKADGTEVYVDGDLVLGIWNHEQGTRLWSLACGYLDLQGAAGHNADQLGIEMPVLTPEERETGGLRGERA